MKTGHSAIIVFALTALAVVAGLLLKRKSPENGVLNAKEHYWICPIPEYSRIELGMAKKEVESILGKPNVVEGRNSALRSNVVSSMAYDLDFSSYTTGSVEVYFDATGRANGKYCGTCGDANMSACLKSNHSLDRPAAR